MVRSWLIVLTICLCTVHADEQRLNLAVTASFKPVIDALGEAFSRESGIALSISSASTGVLYQQILKGAPYDIFFAADAERPKLLAQQLGIAETQLATYAYGQLVLVSFTDAVTKLEDLKHYEKKLIIANPLHAPYGQAADQVLQQFGFKGTKVLANNVSQARQYLSLQLADVGIIAASVAEGLDRTITIDRSLYAAIDQQRLVLKSGPAMSKLLAYLDSPEAHSVLESMGYLLPSYYDN